MLAKTIIASLFCMLLTCGSALDGFDVKFNKFSNYYFLDQHIDWGNLYLEGVDIDFKAAELAQQKLKGGRFDETIHSVVPNDFFVTDREWKQAKDYIAYVIGPIPNLNKKESARWENSSKNVDQLLQDAEQVSPIFKRDFQQIAYRIQAVANFGPNDQFIVKSKKSLTEKVDRDASLFKMSKEEAVIKIGDAIRGTIIVDHLQKIPTVISAIMQYADNKGAKVAFKNLWIEDRESGYVGIHAKILYPLPHAKNGTEDRYILAEMQIHLANMVDGTEASAKERAHFIYEQVRDEDLNPEELAAASKLFFLTAMEEVLAKLEK